MACGKSPSQQTAAASAKQEARGVHKVAANPAGNRINNKNRREVLERKSHVPQFALPERKQQKWGRREEGEEGTETLLLPFGLISRGCGGIKHIPYNSIRETSIKAGTLMRRNTTCVRSRHCPLIKAPQLAGAAAPGTAARQTQRGAVVFAGGELALARASRSHRTRLC